jgi:hypothetical protein
LNASVSSAASAGKPTEPWHPAPAGMVQQVTGVPEVVFDEVGLQPAVTPPVVLSSQPALRFGGKPGVYYLGAEPCPLCAAERWAFIVATSRFGTWSKLGIAQSAANDEFPNTQSFTFLRASFSSPYIAVRTVEHFGSRPLANGHPAILQQPTSVEAAIYNRYDAAKYFPENPGTYPFLDFGNRVVLAGPSYDPGTLAGLSRAQIASDLANPSSGVTKNIVGTANYLAAAICSIDGQRPSSVCASTGVTQARDFAKIGLGTASGNCVCKPSG